MLRCAKRRTPISSQWQLFDNATHFATSLTRNGLGHETFNTSAVTRHLIASRHNQPNAFGAKLLVPTSLLLPNWKTLLSNYLDSIVVDFLSYGWPINYTAPTFPASSLRNHPSASNYDSHVQAYIDNELSWNAIAGPFQYPPLSNDFVCSPLQTVPKRFTLRNGACRSVSPAKSRVPWLFARSQREPTHVASFDSRLKC